MKKRIAKKICRGQRSGGRQLYTNDQEEKAYLRMHRYYGYGRKLGEEKPF